MMMCDRAVEIKVERFLIEASGKLTLPDGTGGPARFFIETNPDLKSSAGLLSGAEELLTKAVSLGVADLHLAVGLHISIAVRHHGEGHAAIEVVGWSH
jgi:hypothetical protein